MSNLSTSEIEYVEQFGRFWEASGSRTTGRIVGWLMICDPAHQSAADLVEALGVSTGSVSTLVRQLMDLGFVERVTFPGDRASYYQMRDHAWTKAADNQMDVFRRLADLAAQGRAMLPPERTDRVDDLAAMTDFFLAEWPDLLDRFHTQIGDGDRATRAVAT